MHALGKKYSSGVVKLNIRNPRLTLPAEVLKSVGWTDSDKSELLIAEFVNPGHFRLHRSENVTKTIELAEKRIAEEAQSPRQEEIMRQVLADQFREVKLYRSDNNRISMKEEIVLALTGDAQIERDVRLYVQAGDSAIDVMIHSVRMDRLEASGIAQSS